MTRKALLTGLADKEFGRGALEEMQKAIEAENSDLFDVLAYVAYLRAPIPRRERAARAKVGINGAYKSDRQLAFLEFVLHHYVDEGVDELDPDKLFQLLRLKYNAIADAAADLGRLSRFAMCSLASKASLSGMDVASSETTSGEQWASYARMRH